MLHQPDDPLTSSYFPHSSLQDVKCLFNRVKVCPDLNLSFFSTFLELAVWFESLSCCISSSHSNWMHFSVSCGEVVSQFHRQSHKPKSWHYIHHPWLISFGTWAGFLSLTSHFGLSITLLDINLGFRRFVTYLCISLQILIWQFIFYCW